MRAPANWSYQLPVPFDVLTANGVPEIFSYTDVTANQATADFICAWNDRYTVIQHLLGTGVFGIAASIWPSRGDLFARRAVLNGMHSLGWDGAWASYEFAKIGVTFLPQPSGQPGNGNTTAYMTVDGDSNSVWMTVPGREVVWFDDGLPLPDPAQIYMPEKVHRLTVHQWASPPFGAMDSAQGRCNSLPVTWVGRTIAAEKLLFDSYRESVDVYLFGYQTFKVEMTFKERRESWNKLPKQNLVFTKTEPLLFGDPVSFAGIFP